MAAIITEAVESRPFTIGQRAARELVFHVFNTTDEAEVKTLLVAAAPLAYAGLKLDALEAEVADEGVWKCHARYVGLEDDTEYTFDTGGGTVKITQSLETIARYAPAGLVAPDFGGAIGVSEDKVEGVDVPVPEFQFTETHKFDDVFILAGYKRVVAALHGKVNDADFKGWSRGEVRFLGANGNKRGDEKWSITFRFAASPNVTGLTVGAITGIDKEGWHYLWFRQADFEDGTAKALVKRPVAAVVDRVSEYGDFSALGIGTT